MSQGGPQNQVFGGLISQVQALNIGVLDMGYKALSQQLWVLSPS